MINKIIAEENIQESMQLVYTGCRYSFYLLSIISIPFMVNLDYLLSLWLGVVPPYTTEFLFLAIVAALINSMSSPLVTAMQATGRIQAFQITICVIMLCEIPLAFITLKLGYTPYMAMIPTIIVVTIGLFARFILLKRLIKSYSIRYFTLCIVIKNILISTGCIVLAFIIHRYFTNNNFISFILSSFTAFLITIGGIYIFGISPREKVFINGKIRRFFKVDNKRLKVL